MSVETPLQIKSELDRLSQVSVDDLRVEWQLVFGHPAPKNARREYLLRSLSHALQVQAFGGLSKKIERGLTKLAFSGKSVADDSSARTRSLKAGTRIYREWDGTVHEIIVTEEGYRHQDTLYKSLSAVARQITGTRWSGPAFFGLKQKATETRDGQ